MFTNTFTPHVGGVANSVASLSAGLRDLGHRVLVIAPEFPDMPPDEADVIRVPAIKHINDTDFSLPLPLIAPLHQALDAFGPDIVHSHHPFLLGDAALRVAASRQLPIVYTYHTRYELYGHYVAQDVQPLRKLVVSLMIGYCDLCNAVIAPSESMAHFLTENGVERPIQVIPTGVEPMLFGKGDRLSGRAAAGIPQQAFCVGHVGRLAPEKNLTYLSNAVEQFLSSEPNAHFLVAGDGEMKDHLTASFNSSNFAKRVHFMGVLRGQELADAYAAMDVFAFSSLSETQGMVLAEAMTAGVPVVALDAPGAREMVRDGENGRLLPAEAPTEAFAAALHWLRSRNAGDCRALIEAARRTARRFDRKLTINQTLLLYQAQVSAWPPEQRQDDTRWHVASRRLAADWDILRNLGQAVKDALVESTAPVT
ncbi:glycosyltransferase involved in cell wall biosynthesis [Neorhizobium galegae]|uniref:glycosyltransferase n=1 Tax=Neorhizobium galegae TaxID=399 RepID=UPI001AE96030|nr:glycosyltransferase [Neorhizobium galegae]MBP2562461.1 glycosyltransferase involved in cell wall biosynthesis [Neorhizobium galegae]